MTRSGHIGYARGMEHRKLRGLANLPGKIQMGRGRHATNGDDLGERGIMLDDAADDVEEINLPGVHQAFANLQAVFLVDAAVGILVSHQAAAHDELRPHSFAHRIQHTRGETQPVLECLGAVIIGSLIGQRRPEAIHQVAVALKLNAIHSTVFHALGGRRIVFDDALNIPVFHLLGERAVRRLTHGRCRKHGQPV